VEGEEESPFENEVEDDSALTVGELAAGIAAGTDGALADHLVIASDGHMELAVDTDTGVVEERDATKMTIDEILAEVEALGRGKRRRIKSKRYDNDFEES
jgi:hypothetical protein